MKYDKLVFSTLVIAAIGALGACAPTGDREGLKLGGSESVELIATDRFLPAQERDDNGEALPYEPMENPYTELSGKLDRDVVTAYIEARRAFSAGRYERADQALADLAEQQPELSGPLVMRGDIAMKRDDLDSAMEYYTAALDVNPINFNAYLRLAKAQRMRGQFHHAQNTYARALEQWPDGAELHLNLGVLYDVYLNDSLQGQAHMEAYQFLSGDKSGEVVFWLEEIRERTGVASALKASGAEGQTDSQLAQSDSNRSRARETESTQESED